MMSKMRNWFWFKQGLFLLCCLMPLSSIAGSLTIDKEIEISSTPQELWSALTDSRDLAQWWGKDVRLQPVLGGEFYEPWGDNQLATGTVVEVEPLNSIKFTWKEKYWHDEITTCQFLLVETDEGVTLRVRHSGWESFQAEEERERMIQGFHQGWDFLLPRLKGFLEQEGKKGL